MSLKSVSINNVERNKIIVQIKKQYAKLALLKHPDPDFTKNLSKDIFKTYILALAKKLTPESVPYIQYENQASFAEAITNLRFQDITIKKLDTEMRYSNELLVDTDRLTLFEAIEINIPTIFENPKHMIPFPFTTWGHNKYNAHKIIVDQETQDSILAYNEQMVTIYSELSKQLDSLLEAVDKCKSTKMFEDKLPNLVSLYPESVHKKIKAKNNVDTEITPEQQSLLDATASLAAASLLEDEK